MLVLNIGVVLAYLVIRNGAVPAHNELVYLLHLAKDWNPELLANDWTFAGSLPSHVVFNLLFGPLTMWMPLEVVGWIGRFLSWSLILVALFQLGKHFAIPRWMITVALLCWLFYGQSVVGDEWILGPFEAKCMAYALLFFSLDGFMRREGVVVPSILLGLAFSFHPLVGLWGGLGVGLTLLILRYPIKTLVKAGCYAAACALPGLIPLLTTATESGASDAWRFVVLVVMPYHFDPLSFAPWKVGVLLMLLAFSWLQVRSTGTHALRFLLVFQTVLGAFFVLGYVARVAENYTVLQLMPFRLFPVLVPLVFFFQLMKTLRESSSLTSGQGLVAAGLLAPVMLGIPAKLFVDHVVRQRALWTWQDEDDLTQAFKWIATSTPPNATAILPPWRKDSFYFARRAQVANWWVLRFDRLSEWRERLESVAGDLSDLTDGTEKAQMSRTVAYYGGLTATEVTALAERYHAGYLVSETAYPYHVVFQSGGYKVYSLGVNGATWHQTASSASSAR